MKVKLTKADLGLSMPTSPLAQVAQGPAPIQAPQLYRTPGFTPSTNMQGTQQNNPNIPNGQGDINWDHVMASYVAQNLASGMVSRFSPNSQQNNMKEFNKQQFSPMNFLPYTQNNSVQAQFGTPQMRQGGQVMSDGGYFGGSDDEMRKWILGEDESTNDTPDAPQQPEQQAPQYNDDALQFANFVQMMGLDQADGEKSPEDNGEDQYMFKDGGIHIKKANRGKFTAYKKRTGKTTEEALHSKDPHVRKMAQFAKNAKSWKKEMGGAVEYSEGQDIDISPEQYAEMIKQGYTFE